MSFNPTLTNLLQLPEPEKDVLYLLQALKEGKHPFYEAKSNSRWVGDIFVSDGAAFFNSGKYGDWKPERKDKTIQAFKLWHLKAVKKLVGLGKLKEIYKTCFKADWELVEKVLNSPNYVRLEEEDRQKQAREAYNYYYSQRTSTSTKWATVLGVSPTATKQEVKAAYRNLCKQYHPDMPTGDAAKMKDINNAYADWERLYQAAV
ncbi:hypothetical protein C7B79_04770 [Chroococcidiopsis cubana CCALA 043]|nr:hypothetical protein C7B79_04770 [Chroococcidiopsis cubana CCALA 043]